MEDLRFFDAHCYVGRYKTFRAGSFYTTEDLLAQMSYYGITEALVTHAVSREHHPIDGNAMVVDEVKRSPSLHASWAFLPTAAKEMPPPAELVSQMISQGVRAAKLFHGAYTFELSDWCIGEVLEALEAHRVPTFIDPDKELDTWDSDKFDWESVDSLCRLHPGLPVVLQEARFRSANRVLYKLLDKHPNLHLELSGYWAHHAVEFITREFGARRLLFGTRMPVRDPACAIGQVAYADISEENRKLIAGDNLRHLLAGVKP
jgi:predicted TIM-barrel fold metal-dependent hydrolase